MNYVEYGGHGDFEVIADNRLQDFVGGFQVQIGAGGRREINNGCVEDVNNNACVNPNTFCAADTACAEVL